MFRLIIEFGESFSGGVGLLCRELDHFPAARPLGNVYGHKVFQRHDMHALHGLDYVWKRPRYVLAPDPDREKKRRIRRRIRCLPRRSVLLAEDEICFARQLGPPWRTNPGAHLGQERAPRGLWHAELANRKATVSDSRASQAV